MEIGQKFTYLSNGRKMKALFIEEKNNKIKAVICDDLKLQGLNIEIDKKLIIN